MSEVNTLSTKVDPDTAEKLQTVVDAEGTTKAQYIRSVLKDALNEDHSDLSDDDQIRAEINQLSRQVDSEDRRGLPDPLGLFE